MSAHVTCIHEEGPKYMRFEVTVAVFLRIQVFWAKVITHKHEKLMKVNSQRWRATQTDHESSNIFLHIGYVQ